MTTKVSSGAGIVVVLAIKVSSGAAVLLAALSTSQR